MIFQSTLVGRKQIAKDTLEISVKRPANFFYKAGQYVQFGVSNLLYPDLKGSSRVFSIVSSPNERKKISVAFRETGSGFKCTLKDLKMGSQILIDGPYGFYTLSQKSSSSIVFLSGGIGVTPHLSMIRFAFENKYLFPITLLYTNKNEASAPYLDELKKISKKNKYFDFRYQFERFSKPFIQKHIKNINEPVWHISGPPGMVDYVKNILFLMGVSKSRVNSEDFVGY